MTEGNQDGVQSYDTREGEGEEKKQHTPLKNDICKEKVGMNVVEDPVIDEKNEDAALISPAMAEEELTDGGATTPTGLISTSITHALHRLECRGKQEVEEVVLKVQELDNVVLDANFTKEIHL
ncbi:hypothetical protein Tco_1555051 [Tanacetum coccineum]